MNDLVQNLRVRLNEKLPEDLNTDFQLQRWIDAYEQVIELHSFAKMHYNEE